MYNTVYRYTCTTYIVGRKGSAMSKCTCKDHQNEACDYCLAGIVRCSDCGCMLEKEDFTPDAWDKVDADTECLYCATYVPTIEP